MQRGGIKSLIISSLIPGMATSFAVSMGSSESWTRLDTSVPLLAEQSLPNRCGAASSEASVPGPGDASSFRANYFLCHLIGLEPSTIP